MMDETKARVEFGDQVNCKNCAITINLRDKYCNLCGQKVIFQRMRTKDVLSDVFASITNIESGLWYTLKILILKPHEFLADYLHGVTKKYTNVFRLIFLLSAASFFINQCSGLMDAQMNAWAPAGDSEKATNVFRELQNYMMYFIFLMIPFFALASYLIFKNRKLRFAEHLVLNSAWLSGTTTLGFLAYLLVPFVSVDNMAVYGGLSMTMFLGYFTYANKKYFNLSWLKSLWLSVLHLVLGYVTFSLIIGLIGLIIGFAHSAFSQ